VASNTAESRFAAELSQRGEGQILCETEDFHRFVVKENEAVLACLAAKTAKTQSEELADQFELTMRRIAAWCQKRQVSRCVFVPRSDDLLVVIVAKGEDADGSLHDEMAALDAELFKRGPFRLSFLLMRESEAKGIGAFVHPGRARVIHSA
jgi:hypothetical protein